MTKSAFNENLPKRRLTSLKRGVSFIISRQRSSLILLLTAAGILTIQPPILSSAQIDSTGEAGPTRDQVEAEYYKAFFNVNFNVIKIRTDRDSARAAGDTTDVTIQQP